MARQRLGQHFLSDVQWREEIARAIGVSRPSLTAVRNESRATCWIELGAGHGEMTQYLARTGDPVCAIELDPPLARRLRDLVAQYPNLSVIHGDILKTDLATIAAGRQVRLYGNLPYYITSPILHHIFASAARIIDIHIVIQLEVAQRLVAQPGTHDYGYLSVLAQYFSQPEILFEIPREAFRPPPEVGSALVAMRLRDTRSKSHPEDETAFFYFVKLCFAHKRKTLVNNLKAFVTPAKLREVLAGMELPAESRAEELSVTQLVSLFTAVRADTAKLPPARKR